MKKLLLTSMIAAFFLVGCGEMRQQLGLKGPAGAPGKDGTSCSVEEVSGGAIVSCPNKSVFIEDGADGIDGKDAVAELIDPCGDGPGFDEVLLRLSTGELIAYFESGEGERHLSVIGPGAYSTTDEQSCRFDVLSDGTVED